MDTHVKWIEHKGEKILLSDYTDLDEERILEAMEEARREILSYRKKVILMLVDITNTYTTGRVKSKGEAVRAAAREKGVTVKTAIVGITAMKKVIAAIVKPGAHFADSIEEAKDWLASQADK